jgi:hypothetical protein
MLHGDKPMLVFIAIQVAIGFIFWLALMMPYMVSSELIGGHLSTLAFPGGTFYFIVFLVLILSLIYCLILGKDKAARKIFLSQAIIATAIYLYALSFHKVGLPSARNGIGKIIEFLMLLMFWFVIFGKKYVFKIVHKFFPNPEAKEPVEVN